MWFRFAVVAVRLTGPKKAAHVFLKCGYNGGDFQVSDASLGAFCLPLGAESQTPKDRMAQEEYMFTLTQGDGTRVQGFCRRFLPPPPRAGGRLRYPQVLCLVCEAPWAALFFKALEVAEQLLCQGDLLHDPDAGQLPAGCPAGAFLAALEEQLRDTPPLGSVIRVPLPLVASPLSISPPKRTYIGPGNVGPLPPLECSAEALELQIPPDCGNGYENAGVSLARLLYHVPIPAMVTLMASLLLERRVVIVGQSRDTVSAAVCAANALLYPFKWHHIYLPLLPVSFKDYLTAPMPFLIGLPAQLLPALKGIPMNEVTMIDLDLGKCEPAPGSALDDARHLPWRDMLEGALSAAFGMLRSPVEHESNPLISSIIQGYFLKLIGNYRSFIYPDSRSRPSTAPSTGPPSPHGGGGGGGGLARQSLQARAQDRDADAIRGSKYVFDHAGLVASHRRNDKARAFLQLMRGSQLYQEFIQERLKIAAECGYDASLTNGSPSAGGAPPYGAGPQHGGGMPQGGALRGGDGGGVWEEGGDPFEERVSAYLDNRSRRLEARLKAGVRSSLSRFQALMRKHARRDGMAEVDLARAKQLASAFMAGTLGAVRRTLESGGGGADGASGSGGALGGLQQLFATAPAHTGYDAGHGGGGGGGLARHHGHSVSMDAINLLGGGGGGGGAGGSSFSFSISGAGAGAGASPTAASVAALSFTSDGVFDPSAFFEDEEEEVDEADAAAAAAAAERGGGRLSRNASNSSLSSMGGLSSGPSFTGMGGGGPAGASGGGGSFCLSRASAPTHMQRPAAAHGPAAAGGGRAPTQEWLAAAKAAASELARAPGAGAAGPLIDLGAGDAAAAQQPAPPRQAAAGPQQAWGAPPPPRAPRAASVSFAPAGPLPQPPQPRHSLHSHLAPPLPQAPRQQQQQQQQQQQPGSAQAGPPAAGAGGAAALMAKAGELPFGSPVSSGAAHLIGVGSAAPQAPAPAADGWGFGGGGGDDPFAMLAAERSALSSAGGAPPPAAAAAAAPQLLDLLSSSPVAAAGAPAAPAPPPSVAAPSSVSSFSMGFRSSGSGGGSAAAGSSGGSAAAGSGGGPAAAPLIASSDGSGRSCGSSDDGLGALAALQPAAALQRAASGGLQRAASGGLRHASSGEPCKPGAAPPQQALPQVSGLAYRVSAGGFGRLSGTGASAGAGKALGRSGSGSSSSCGDAPDGPGGGGLAWGVEEDEDGDGGLSDLAAAAAAAVREQQRQRLQQQQLLTDDLL